MRMSEVYIIYNISGREQLSLCLYVLLCSGMVQINIAARPLSQKIFKIFRISFVNHLCKLYTFSGTIVKRFMKFIYENTDKNEIRHYRISGKGDTMRCPFTPH